MKSAPQYPMAVDRACWAGEPVAMVVARTRAEAEDAAEQIVIEWQELPAVTEKKTALDPGTPAIHPELGDNLAFRKTIDTGRSTPPSPKPISSSRTRSSSAATRPSAWSRARLLADYDKAHGQAHHPPPAASART